MAFPSRRSLVNTSRHLGVRRLRLTSELVIEEDVPRVLSLGATLGLSLTRAVFPAQTTLLPPSDPSPLTPHQCGPSAVPFASPHTLTLGFSHSAPVSPASPAPPAPQQLCVDPAACLVVLSFGSPHDQLTSSADKAASAVFRQNQTPNCIISGTLSVLGAVPN